MARRPSVFDYFGLMFYFEWVARPVHVMDSDLSTVLVRLRSLLAYFVMHSAALWQPGP